MRDLVLFAFLAFVLWKVWKAPIVGALAWVIFGVMNPHRLAYGPAYSFPFALVAAIALVLSLLVYKGHKRLKGGSPGVALMVFVGWCTLTTALAFQPDAAWDFYFRVIKTFVMTAVILVVMHTRRHVDLLIWTLALGIGFYGVKGGLFVLATGGSHMVNGPPGGVLEGNNSLAVGLVATIPLLFYLMTQQSRRWVRSGLVLAMALCSVAILGSFSRGALLAISAMGAVLWLRGSHKFSLASALVIFALVAVPFMPSHWADRMQTIQTYEEDNSAMFRLQTWETAYRIALDRFPVGGGFEWFSAQASARYSPNPQLVMSPHSIYFEILGTQGFIGLFIYLVFWFLVWRQCTWLRRQGLAHPQFEWARTLGSMVQVSIIGYMVGGSFLNLAFWEFCFYLYAAVGAACYVVAQGTTPVAAVGTGRSVQFPADAASGQTAGAP